jgi:hypothetical protein
VREVPHCNENVGFISDFIFEREDKWSGASEADERRSCTVYNQLPKQETVAGADNTE